jgi:predicted nucleotidyltransferase
MVQIVDDPLACLQPHERGWVESFRDRVRELLGERLRDLRLYGSKVRGDSHEDSDIDLLVLVNDLDFESKLSIIDLASSISPLLSPFVEDFDRYHRPANRATGFYKELRTESLRL